MLIWKYFEDVKFVDTCYNTLYLEYLLLILDIVIYQTVDRQSKTPALCFHLQLVSSVSVF